MNQFILKNPVITEKSLFIANNNNTYTFEVATSATKTQVVEAVEKLFNVKVIGVSTVMRSRSLRKTGKKRTTVLVPRKKKAMVKLAKDQTIALFDLSEQVKK